MANYHNNRSHETVQSNPLKERKEGEKAREEESGGKGRRKERKRERKNVG